MSSSRNPSRVARTKRRQLRLLFTCVGRRVELLRAFRRAGEDLGVGVEIHGADASWLSPAMHDVDKGHQVAPISSGRYIQNLIEIVRESRIDLLIPLIDTELPLIADAAPALADAGCLALISSPGVVAICRDKVATFETLKKAGIDTPTTWTWMHDRPCRRDPVPCRTARTASPGVWVESVSPSGRIQMSTVRSASPHDR